MKKLNTTEIILLGAFALVLAYAWQKGLFKSEKGYKTNPGNATDNSTPSKDINTYKNIAKAFRDSLLGNSTSWETFQNACDSLLNLNDSDLIGVSNQYNKLYLNKEYNTLRSLLVQEWAIHGTSAQKKTELLNRFNKIGI